MEVSRWSSTAKMHRKWRSSVVIPLYKNKGDIQDCNNFRGIKLLNHTMKLWERVIERRWRNDISIFDNQFGFMPGRSTIEVIYLLRRLMGLYRNKEVDLHMVFIDLEKAYDRVPREVLWRCLEKKWVSPSYIQVIKDMYEGGMMSVRTPGGVHQWLRRWFGAASGFYLKPFSFYLSYGWTYKRDSRCVTMVLDLRVHKHKRGVNCVGRFSQFLGTGLGLVWMDCL